MFKFETNLFFSFGYLRFGNGIKIHPSDPMDRMGDLQSLSDLSVTLDTACNSGKCIQYLSIQNKREQGVALDICNGI